MMCLCSNYLMDLVAEKYWWVGTGLLAGYSVAKDHYSEVGQLVVEVLKQIGFRRLG